MFVFLFTFSFCSSEFLAERNPEERNVLDELLGEHPNDDDDLTDELHLAASGESVRGWE